MSIEKDLSRIADALEKLVEVKANPMRMISAVELPPVEAPKTSMTPVSKAGIMAFTPPGIGVPAIAPATVPMTAPAPVMPLVNGPASPEELRKIAQGIAQKCGPKTLAFTQWVNELLVPYGVKTLLAVPADKMTEVAAKLMDWAKKEGINA